MSPGLFFLCLNHASPLNFNWKSSSKKDDGTNYTREGAKGAKGENFAICSILRFKDMHRKKYIVSRY